MPSAAPVIRMLGISFRSLLVTGARDEIPDGAGEAAIDDDSLAVDVAGAIAGEEGDGFGDVGGGADAAHRHGGAAPLGDAGRDVERLAHRGADEAGADDVAAHAARAPFAGELARKHVDAGLA